MKITVEFDVITNTTDREKVEQLFTEKFMPRDYVLFDDGEYKDSNYEITIDGWEIKECE